MSLTKPSFSGGGRTKAKGVVLSIKSIMTSNVDVGSNAFIMA